MRCKRRKKNIKKFGAYIYMYVYLHTINHQKTHIMETFTNRWGEKVTKWKSCKHPDNPNFMQIVNWYVWEKPDGRITVGYNLGANGKTYFLYNLTAQEAIEKYS